MLEEILMSKYVLVCLYYKIENGKSFVQFGNKYFFYWLRNVVFRQLGWVL